MSSGPAPTLEGEALRLKGLADAAEKERWWADARAHRSRVAHLLAKLGKPAEALAALGRVRTADPWIMTARAEYLLALGHRSAANRALAAAVRRAQREGLLAEVMHARALQGLQCDTRFSATEDVGLLVAAVLGDEDAFDGLRRRQGFLSRNAAWGHAWEVRRFRAIALAWRSKFSRAWSAIAEFRRGGVGITLRVQSTAALVAAFIGRRDAIEWAKFARQTARRQGFQREFHKLADVVAALERDGVISRALFADATGVAAILAQSERQRERQLKGRVSQ